MHIAQKVRLEKEAHPERFCRNPRCLWRIVSGCTGQATPCRKHPITYQAPVAPEVGK
jgi:hypothetical protein